MVAGSPRGHSGTFVALTNRVLHRKIAVTMPTDDRRLGDSSAPRGSNLERSMGYQPSLYGLRAISVLAVIAYHAGASWMTGGFFGVEVFFVVSGYLITTLLLIERQSSGITDLRQFWVRRARRLLPALFVMLIAVAAWVALVGTAEQQSTLRRDMPWSLFYVNNWGQIVG